MPGKDSSELMWEDINRPKFYAALTLSSAAIRTCLYPAALVKTRLQTSGSGGAGAAGAASGSAISSAAKPTFAAMSYQGGSSAMLHPVAAGASSSTLHMPPLHHSSAGALTMPVYRNTTDAFRTIARMEGLFALYRGFRMNIMGLACDPIVIGCIEFSRSQMTEMASNLKFNPDGTHSSPIFRYIVSPTTAITMVSAGGSAVVGQIIQVPVDVISQKKQIQLHPLKNEKGLVRAPPGTSSLAIARSIIDKEGVKGLYKGFGITLVSAIPFTSILWSVYWPTQKFLFSSLNPTFQAPVKSGETNSGVFNADDGGNLERREEKFKERTKAREMRARNESVTSQEGSYFNWRASIPTPISAFVASATASLATQPIDVIKTRLQVQGGSGTLASTVKALLKERGYKGLMSGWYPRILAVSPQATIMMSSYEVLKRYCQK